MPAQQVRHPLFARFYTRLSSRMEDAGVGRHRQSLLAGLAGSVIEVGAGNGLNFSHYPPAVTSVLAVEPEQYLRALAVQQAALASVPVSVTAGTAEQLPAGDETFDNVVATLMLCSVTDLAGSLAEMHRVLRAGGELRFMEHVLAPSPGMRRIQWLADATCWPRCFGGCHAARDTVQAIASAGFEIRELERYRQPDTPLPWPSTPHASGIAVRLS
jgi:ubiquinone/menaquinone biosynthesis C-methylase UbiE